MVLEAFAQTKCGENTHSVTKDGVLTCVLNDPQPQPTGSFSGLSPSLDFSSPDAIQNSMFETLLPNLVKLADGTAVYDILVYLTSLAGIIPMTAGGLVGLAFLIRKMKKDKMQKKSENGVMQFLCMKCDSELTEKEYMEHGGLCVDHRTKKKFKKFNFSMPKVNMPKLNLKKKSKDPDLDIIHKEMEKRGIKTKEEYDKMMSEVTPSDIQKEIESRERDLDVIANPDEATEVMEEIDEMVEDKEKLEEKYASPEEALIASLDPAPTEVKDPEEMSIEELEDQIKEKDHKVEVSDGKLDITQKPEIINVEKKSELEAVKEVIEENANKMEKEFGEALDENDFEPSEEEIQEAQEKFENEIEENAEQEQESPNEEDILEVQRLMTEENMTQDEAIQVVISKKAPKPEPKVIEFIEESENKTLEERHEAQDIEEMSDERDIFKLDIPKKKQSPLQKKFAKSSLGKKLMKNSELKQKEKERAKETRMVLNDLGEQRMLEYAKKIYDKLEKWGDEQLHHTYEQKEKTTGEKNLSPAEIQQELKKFALFASMCEMMVDKKTSKKRYWIRTNKYETA